MLLVRNGVGEMLGVLFNRYQSPLFNFYCRLTGDRETSEDLVQEVFYRILKYRHTFQPGTSFRTWMYHIARNARFDRMKKQRSETEIEPQLAPAFMPIDCLQHEQETALLHCALMRLPADKREVLVLSRFQELTYQEIAHLLGCEAGAVKVRVYRALQELRQIFHRLSLEKGSPGAAGERP